MNTPKSAYAAAGVDIDAQEKGLARVKQLAKSTFTPGVLTEIGSFGGLFRPELAGMTEPVTEPGYPEPESFPVRRCLQAILNEEWEHRLYAERDFDVLEARAS